MKNGSVAVIAVFGIAIGIAAGYGVANLRDAHTAQAATSAAPYTSSVAGSSSATTDRKVLYWYDPMSPQQKFDKPGKSPYMDMQLVPKYADEEAGGVRVDPRVAQSLGLRLATVTRERMGADVDAVATVGFNERDVAIVQARTGGFVERVYARAAGDVIAANAALVDVLVPEWAGAQQEFLAVRTTGDMALAQAARQRLRLLGMSDALIARVEQTNASHAVITITTPIGGVIQELGVRAGMSVTPGMTLAKINGIGTVWLEAAVPELHAAHLRTGRPVQAIFAAYPGETFKGRIAAVLPEANKETRTLRVRMEFPNPGMKLKAGMFGQIAMTGYSEEALVVPSEAVVRTGSRAIVFVAEGEGRYRPVEITPGREVNGKLVVLNGLEEGQQIVASGQFLIDSEASLRGLLTAPPGSSAAMTGKQGNSPADVAEASGNVVEIAKGQVTIAHGPVPTLKWPAMTMGFDVRDTTVLKGVAKGDRVRFTFRKTDGGYEIVSIAKQSGST